MKVCARCKTNLAGKSFVMSMFNTDEICMDCKAKEVKHPLYETARQKEREEVQKGNYNFEGIGLPDDLK